MINTDHPGEISAVGSAVALVLEPKRKWGMGFGRTIHLIQLAVPRIFTAVQRLPAERRCSYQPLFASDPTLAYVPVLLLATGGLEDRPGVVTQKPGLADAAPYNTTHRYGIIPGSDTTSCTSRSMSSQFRLGAVALTVLLVAGLVPPTEQSHHKKKLKLGAAVAAAVVGKVTPLALAAGAAGASLVGSAAVSHLINSHHHHGGHHHHHHFLPVHHTHKVHIPIP
ncbi:hypothetical protein HPB51_020444 [Rhipicephalus microplus]|uniref:Uncharacterized protein n=1 Tax=Rhipicephalus microplus TaxID=6941 RepID=A0A9J6DC25_RHIMP|nr:hypothetical protein HPB51_020444 [Rhipicephalus microplus]